MSAESIDLDLSGLKCPLPVLRTRKALRMLGPGGRLSVVCTDPLSVIDIPHLVAQEGDQLLSRHQADGVFRFVIRRAGPVAV